MDQDGVFSKMKKEFLDKLVFLDLKKRAVLGENQKGEIPVPIYFENFSEGVKTAKYEESIPLQDIVEGIAILLGCDRNFKYKEDYLNILKRADKNIHKYIFSLSIKNAQNSNFELAYILLECISEFLINDYVVKYNKGICLFNIFMSKKYSEYDQQICEEAIKLFQTDSEGENKKYLGKDYIGMIYFYQKEYSKAHENLEKFITNYDGDKNSEWYIDVLGKYKRAYNIIQFENGVFNFENKKYDKAIRYFLPILDTNPNWFGLLFLLGKCYRAIGSIDEAEKYLLQALKIDGKNGDLNNELGLCYYIDGEVEEAEKCFKKALESEPGSVIFLTNMASLYIDLKKYDKALEYIETVLKVEPKDEIALQCKDIIQQALKK